jgi:hypothetical protein
MSTADLSRLVAVASSGRQVRPMVRLSLLFVADSREMQIEKFVRLAHVLAMVGRVSVSFTHFKIVIKANGLSIPIQRPKRKETIQ